MTEMGFRAGAACLSIQPPLGLPMVGFIRQRELGQGYGLPLEATALVLERDGVRVVLCGVDAGIITVATADLLRERIANALGAEPAAVLLNLNHTHLAPLACARTYHLVGELDEETRRASDAHIAGIQDRVVSVCRLAAERLEPAAVAWAVGEVGESVNRRERTEDGQTVLGWNPHGLLDRQVTALQVRRPAGEAIATLVAFGCHPVTTGYDMSIYSADYPGAMRAVVRANGGGECVFFQGAGGNVLPRVAFTRAEREAGRMGRRIALEALRALADRPSGRRRVVAQPEASLVSIVAYRVEEDVSEPPALAAVGERLRFPLEPLPEADEIADFRDQCERSLAAARASGDAGRVKVALVPARWARWVEGLVRDGAAPGDPEGPVHAVRVGDGVIVTGPAEVFTEIGLAVKERSPGRPTLFAGYTNGLIGYLPCASEYPHGGYEVGFSHRGFMLPAPLAPACDPLLVETGVRLAERLFPSAPRWERERGWVASGTVPPLEPEPLTHPGGAVRPGTPRWSDSVEA